MTVVPFQGATHAFSDRARGEDQVRSTKFFRVNQNVQPKPAAMA
jgi:hypothetical protein